MSNPTASIGLLFGVVLLANPTTMSAADAADMILFNGKVITVDAQDRVYRAIAIKEGKILQAGDDQQIKAFAGPLSRMVNLKGKTVTPGLIDSHYHLMYYGNQFWPGYLNIRVPAVRSKADLLRVVEERVKSLKKDEWISGNQGFYLLPNETVDRRDLDSVAPENPVYLRHGSGQYSVVNSKALEIAKIDGSTPNPPGSRIVKDAQGQPTGMLSHYPAENLVGWYATGYGDRTEEQRLEDIERGQQLALQAGITSVQDVIVGNPQDIQLYIDFAESGRLKIRLYALLYLNTEQQATFAARNYRPSNVGRFVFGGWKLAMDGGVAAKTALLYDKTLFASSASYPYYSQEELDRIVQALHDTGLQVDVHVIGDEGIDMTLTAFEKAMRNNPRPDPRHRIEHGIYPSPSALRRMKDAGVILSTQPAWLGFSGDTYLQTTNEETMKNFFPLKTLLDLGGHIALGIDVPASPYQEPKWTFHGAVTRRTPTRVLNPQEKLNIHEALRLHTMGSAYAGFAETTTGSLEPGKYADLVVWSHDLYTMSPDELNDLAAEMTIVNGEILYDAGKILDKCPCDINGDGVVNVLDSQRVLDAAFGTGSGGCTDVNGDGSTNILDVQIIISTVLDPQGRCRN